MSTDRNKTFGKKEHLCKLTLIEQLFGGGAKAMTAWPMRMVFLLVDKKDEQAPSVQVLISVSKRYFKHAVKRNRVKRQIREAFVIKTRAGDLYAELCWKTIACGFCLANRTIAAFKAGFNQND